MTRSDTFLEDNAVLVRNDADLLTAEVDGELMGMSIEQGTCYGFNPVGTRIWQLLAEPCSLDALCAQLVIEYEVDDRTCRREVLALVERLRDEGLVSVAAA